MKFSVVIPTRNRLGYLKIAVASILDQNYDNFEVIISDNDSAEDIRGYVSSLHDPRVLYSRTEQFISVTDNWNRALNQSSGEYVILIGDDDCLMKGCFSTLHELILQHSHPDLVFSNGLIYIYPEVVASEKGLLTTIGNWHLWQSATPCIVDQKKAHHLVKKSLNFKLHFSYNMQVLTIRSSLIEKLKFKGHFFHSPYPDFYAMTMLLHKAEKILASPYPVTIVGVSPQSFGGLHATNREDAGMEALNVVEESSQYSELDHLVLPGKKFNTCWLYALYSAQKNLADSNLKIGFRRFRRIQILEYLQKIKNHPERKMRLKELRKLCRLWEQLVYGPIIASFWLIESIFGVYYRDRLMDKIASILNVHRGHINYRFKKEYDSIVEIANEISSHTCESNFKRVSSN